MANQRIPKASIPAPSDSIRAQLLATEHWSLLATRGMTWSEVMSRITIHLSITSASLVVLALVAQVSGVNMRFKLLAIGLTAAILILGTLTNVRVHNASVDDGRMLQGMNRLRAAYVELDPGLAQYLVTSYHDDHAGLMQTYLMGSKRSMPSHIFGSTTMYMHIVNALTAGTLAAFVANTAGGGLAATLAFGLLAGMLCLLCWLEIGRRSFKGEKLDPKFPSAKPLDR